MLRRGVRKRQGRRQRKVGSRFVRILDGDRLALKGRERAHDGNTFSRRVYSREDRCQESSGAHLGRDERTDVSRSDGGAMGIVPPNHQGGWCDHTDHQDAEQRQRTGGLPFRRLRFFGWHFTWLHGAWSGVELIHGRSPLLLRGGSSVVQ